MWANSPPFQWNLVKWSIGAVDIIVGTCPVLTSEAPVARLKASGFVVLNSRQSVTVFSERLVINLCSRTVSCELIFQGD